MIIFYRIGSGLFELAKLTEVQCFLYARTPKDVMKEKLIYTPGVLRKVLAMSTMLFSILKYSLEHCSALKGML